MRQVETSDSEFYYGDEGTIHGNTDLDIEVRDGKVVSVWFRCLMLPFNQVDVDHKRAHEMEGADASVSIKGLVVERDS